MGKRVAVRGQIAYPWTEKRLLFIFVCSLRANVSWKPVFSLTSISVSLGRNEHWCLASDSHWMVTFIKNQKTKNQTIIISNLRLPGCIRMFISSTLCGCPSHTLGIFFNTVSQDKAISSSGRSTGGRLGCSNMQMLCEPCFFFFLQGNKEQLGFAETDGHSAAAASL